MYAALVLSADYSALVIVPLYGSVGMRGFVLCLFYLLLFSVYGAQLLWLRFAGVCVRRLRCFCCCSGCGL